jgi:hypothetical protein
MPNTPSLWGMARGSFGFCRVVFRTVFPLVVRLWLPRFLPEAFEGVSVLQPEINMVQSMLYSERRVCFF